MKKITAIFCLLSMICAFDCVAQKKVRRATFISGLDEKASIAIFISEDNKVENFRDHTTLDLTYMKPHINKKRKYKRYIHNIIVNSEVDFGPKIVHAARQQGLMDFINNTIDRIDNAVFVIKSNDEDGLIVELQSSPETEESR